MQMSSGTQQQQQLLGCVLSFLNRPKLNAWIKSLVHLPFPPANAIAVSCGFFITRPPPHPWQRGNVAALKWKFVILPLIYANTPRVHFFKRKNEIAPFVDIDRPHNNNNNCGIINICCCQFTILKERRNENCVALGLEIELSWAVDHHLRFISLVVRVWHDDMNMLASTTAISSSLPIDINSACARWRRRFWSVPRVESSFNLEIMSWKCDSLVAVYSLSKWSLRTARDFSFHSSSLLK